MFLIEFELKSIRNCDCLVIDCNTIYVIVIVIFRSVIVVYLFEFSTNPMRVDS